MGFPKKICMIIQVTIADLQFPYLLFKSLFNNFFNNFFLNYFSNQTFGFTNKLVDQYAGSLISSYQIHSQSHLLVDHMQFVEQDIYHWCITTQKYLQNEWNSENYPCSTSNESASQREWMRTDLIWYNHPPRKKEKGEERNRGRKMRKICGVFQRWNAMDCKLFIQ